jgi:hypothetical protein
MKDELTAYIRVRTCTNPSEIYPEAESGSVWLEVYKNYGALFKKKIGLQKYEYKIRNANDYFCRMRK